MPVQILIQGTNIPVNPIANDQVWTLIPGSEGGAEVLMSLGFIALSLILLKLTKKRAVLWLITGIYLFAVIFFTLLVRTPSQEAITFLTPFQTIRNAISFSDGFTVLSRANLYQVIANVLLFLPLGYLLPQLFRPMRHWYATIPVGLFGSLVIETTQLITHLGCFDVDDLITNTIGAAVGYLIYRIILRK